MHAKLTYAAFGWLTFTGVAHFLIDVLSQHFRGKRVPGAETMLYYGLHSAFALGQVLFGLLCLWIAHRHPGFLADRAVAALALVAAVGWAAISFVFMEYWQPKMNIGIFVVLLGAAIATAR
ncbi:MAG: hypothetical protein DI569_00010 [Sphingopyxis macrogoltabida]|uniref:Uncharacterized protein n=1 Tax=Sphingopyxis macrogoltabida TaxID=33050 RepID=A0A2W5MXU7_SPHMC|nr:MAG: hypothetical protein DI569_00010 [Sphingopyxis macrogoltabida]